MRTAIAVVLALCGTARAERYVVQRGETLEQVAEAFHCATDDVLRANGLDTTLVPPGTVIEVPACGRPMHARAQLRSPRRRDDDDDPDARARAALAVIDGTAAIDSPHRRSAALRGPDLAMAPSPSLSRGEPWRGALEHGRALPASDAYVVRRPAHAYGAAHVVEQLRDAIADVRASHPDVPVLAIGDLSAQHGGKLADHLSHQSGLDVDVGFYFTKLPAGYPDNFVAANADFDLDANWALLSAFFASSQSRRDGVQIIFLDYDVQARLYRYALAHGASKDVLARVFQYPRPRTELVGLVRHWPNHGDHFHVRFAP